MSRRGPFHGIRRFLSPVRRNDADVARDVDDEVRFHLDMQVEALVARGVPRDEAEREARARFGDVAAATSALRAGEARHERHRARRMWLEEWWRDTALVFRQLRRAPAFTLLVVATLGLGIGATSAIFTVVRGILLAPLPFKEPERLVRVVRDTPVGMRQSASGGDFVEFARESKTLSALTSYNGGTGNLVGFGAPQRVNTARVSANFFEVLGLRPLLGRWFTPAEDAYNAAEVAVISEGAWQRLFGGDRNVLGRTVRLDGKSVQIVGVMPKGTEFPAGAELWLPAQIAPGLLADGNRGASFLRLVGRLAPGVTLDQANAEFAAMSRSISERFPAPRAGVVSRLENLPASIVGDVRGPLWIMLGAVVLVLLVACTNVAALLLGRMMARENEIAIRASLGAGRARLMQQLLTESITLGLVGAALGTVLSLALVRLLVALAPDIPRIGEVHVNAPVLLFSIGLGLLTGVLFGVVPAWQWSKRDVQARLRGSGRGLSGNRQTARMRGALVVAQLSLAIVLLTGAGLLLRSFAHMQSVDPGFATSGVTMFTVTLPQVGRYDESNGGEEGERQFVRDAIDALRTIPGVQRVGATSAVPLSGNNMAVSFTIDGRAAPAAGEEPESQLRIVTPDYFAVMGMAIKRGRAIDANDRHDAPIALVISESMAEQEFRGEDPLGKHLSFGWSRDSQELKGEIVGVVRDVKHQSLVGDAVPVTYVGVDQWPMDEYTFVVRSPLAVGTVGSAAVDAIRAIDPELPLYDLRSSAALVEKSLATTRLYLVLLSLFASVALFLATCGIYGVVSFGVEQRTREIGIRVALGASRSGVRAMVVRDGLRLVVAGVTLGTAGALSVTGLLRGVLYGVQPTDPVTLASVSALLAVAAVLASLIPAVRAARIDPQTALRAD